MSTTLDLRNHFLISTPSLANPHFTRSVTLICEHDSQGTMGLIINRPMGINFGEVLRQMNVQTEFPEIKQCEVLLGGPVQPGRGFIVHQPHGEWQSSMKISDEISVTNSRDILESIAAKQGPERSVVTIGYAGWGPGQLEKELGENAWLVCAAEAELIFDAPIATRWEQAAKLLGVDIFQLSNMVGHA